MNDSDESGRDHDLTMSSSSGELPRQHGLSTLMSEMKMTYRGRRVNPLDTLKTLSEVDFDATCDTHGDERQARDIDDVMDDDIEESYIDNELKFNKLFKSRPVEAEEGVDLGMTSDYEMENPDYGTDIRLDKSLKKTAQESPRTGSEIRDLYKKRTITHGIAQEKPPTHKMDDFTIKRRDEVDNRLKISSDTPDYFDRMAESHHQMAVDPSFHAAALGSYQSSPMPSHPNRSILKSSSQNELDTGISLESGDEKLKTFGKTVVFDVEQSKSDDQMLGK
jgi:hypothetical protein